MERIHETVILTTEFIPAVLLKGRIYRTGIMTKNSFQCYSWMEGGGERPND